MAAVSRDVTYRGFGWQDWIVILSAVTWIAGSAVSAVLWILKRRRLRLFVRSLQLADWIPERGREDCFNVASGGFAMMAREVCETVGLRKLPPIAISPSVPMPLVVGLRRPAIVIPCELMRPEAGSCLRDVLIHEAAHVARCDAWVNVGQRLASVLWWWHPGVHGLNRIIARSREEVCDNFVLCRCEPLQYAQTLLELAEKCSFDTQMSPSLGLFESRWTLESRVRGLLKPGRKLMTRINRGAYAIIAVLLGAVCLLIGGISSAQHQEEGATQSSQAAPPVESATPPVESKPSTRLRKVIVRGRCVNDEAKPLGAVRVVILRRSEDYRSQFIAGETKADAQGRFELHDIETAMVDRGDLLAVAALQGYVSVCVPLVNSDKGVIEQKLALSGNPGTLSGIVSDSQGRPISGVTVYLPCGASDEPLLGIRSSVTDEQGRYAITDLKRWTPESTRTFDPSSGRGTIVASCYFYLKHPRYPNTMAQHSAVPQEVNVTLYPPAIVEGRVIDMVTNQPRANVTVSAQGVARHGWYQTRTDAQGQYRLQMTRDHYNIWAEAEDRISVAVNALKAERGETASNVDIRLVRGGFVVGTVFGDDGKPLSPTKGMPARVAHYGPARPRTGAAVTSTPVQSDGTYRLRVAPGRNFIYSMSGSGTSGYVTVEDGRDVMFDIYLGKKQTYQPEDENQRLGRKIRQAAEEEDADMTRSRSPVSGRKQTNSRATKTVSRKRPATKIGKLLDELAEQNASGDLFHDVWARTLKAIVDLGPEAVPELIAELDATNDNMMLRCLGFTLRAIGDKRAVPALIRALPKTLFPPGSDMGLQAEDKVLAKFMQQHDLDKGDSGERYSFGRPVREIFGALHKLTGNSFDEEQIYHVFAEGTPRQQELKKELFARVAKSWADWWEQHWREHLKDPAYSRVNLPVFRPAATAPVPLGQKQRIKTGSSASGWILGSYVDPKTRTAFLDLDTGRASGLPEKWRKANDIESHKAEIEAWAAQEGFDLMGTEYRSPENNQRCYALRPIGLQAWELGEKRWKMRSEDITFETLQREGSPVTGLLLHSDRNKAIVEPKRSATFLFKTREGTPGLLFVGIEVRDDSQKPGGAINGDVELQPIGFSKGRRFGWTTFELRPQENP